MNIFKAMAVKSVEETTRWIPVIDFGPAFRGETGALDAAAAKVRPAGHFAPFFENEAHVQLRFNDSGAERYSIAFFYSPNPASVIECLPSCTGPNNTPHYPPARYRDLILEFFDANYFHRKECKDAS